MNKYLFINIETMLESNNDKILFGRSMPDINKNKLSPLNAFYSLSRELPRVVLISDNENHKNSIIDDYLFSLGLNEDFKSIEKIMPSSECSSISIRDFLNKSESEDFSNFVVIDFKNNYKSENIIHEHIVQVKPCIGLTIDNVLSAQNLFTIFESKIKQNA